MADSTGQVERPASRWRERLPVFLILVAVVIAGSFLAPDSAGDTGAILDVETDVAPTPAPSGAPTPAAEPEAVDPSGPSPRRVAGEWLEMAAEPTATYRGPSVWTGSELVVWGGQAAIRQAPRLTFLAEGAAYDPAGGSWRAIAASPLTPRLEAIAVWTGTEVLIWGGIGASSYLADGAAYNPAMDSWRPLAASPLAPRTGSAGIWTGTELLVIGGFDNFGMLRDGAAYDPVGDSWRPTADVPGEMELYGDLDGLWTGDSALIWPKRDGGLLVGARYLVGEDAWRPVPEPDDGGFIQSAVWDGEHIVAAFGSYASGGLTVRALAPGTPEWERLPDAPALEAQGASLVQSDAGLLLLTADDSHWLYEPLGQVWARLPRGPGIDHEAGRAVWTGRELIAWKPPFAAGIGRKGVIFRFEAQRPRIGRQGDVK